jgi:uncharacterized protein YjbI with pentapeptide repeats
VGKPPTTPYPPDVDDDAEPVEELGDMVDAIVAGADWANQQARRAVLRRVELTDCRLTGAELAEAALSDVTVTACRLELAGMRMARLERVVFRDCEMGECDLYAAVLQDVLFERCVLHGATLTGATMTRVELRGCDLTGVLGAEALRGARMPFADMIENGPLFASALGIDAVD